ncbi:MAG: Asp/Glu racemase, partial [Rhodospirillales bacterium]|nr:Asp/Glu racemase [Rhodospirillales bacterium]
PLRSQDGPEIECRTLADGPIAIENEIQGAQVVPSLCRLIEQESEYTGAFVVACYSDPGVLAARDVTDKPVIGICEAGLSTALNFGDRVGVLHNGVEDIIPAMRGARALGLDSRVVGGRSIDVPMARMDEQGLVLEQMTKAAHQLEDELHASVLVFGCAAMTPFRRSLEKECGLPVIDPAQAAVGMAITAVRCFSQN